MSGPPRHRKDRNHRTCAAALTQLGYWFWDASQSDLGVDGFAVGHGRIIPVEFKHPDNVKLTPNETRVHQQLKIHGFTVEIMTGVDDKSLEPFLHDRGRNFYDPR
jgi:hypothetical protein